MALFDANFLSPRGLPGLLGGLFAQPAPYGGPGAPMSLPMQQPQQTIDMSARSAAPPAPLTAVTPAPSGVLPQPQEPSIGDRLSAFAHNPSGAKGVIPKLIDAFSGLTTGVRTDPQGIEQAKMLSNYRSLVASGVPDPVARLAAVNPAAMTAVLGKYIAPKNTNNITEFEYSQNHPGFENFRQNTTNKFGLTPIYATGPNGETVLLQPGTNGTPNVIQMPPGVKPSSGVEKVDLGTQWALVNKRSGQTIGFMPKDVEGKAKQEAVGKGEGAAENAFRSMNSKMPGLEKVVSGLGDLAKKATYTYLGQGIDFLAKETGLGPTAGALARTKYNSTVSNVILPLLRDTFGAQFTEREGATLRATLGDPNVTPAEKQAVLESFIAQKRRDVEALARQAGMNGNKAAAAPAASSAPAASVPPPPPGFQVVQ